MGIWANTFGDGNSFKESVANTFTKGDGASYVGGTLQYDKDGGVGGGGVVKQNEDGTYGTSTDNDGKGYTGSANSAGTNTETTAKMVFGEAPSGLKAAAGFANPLGIIGKLAGWANSLDPATQAIGDLKTASGAIQKVYQNPETGFTYSYNYLGQPYEVEDVDGIAKKSKGAAIFYAWNKGMLDEWKEEQAADAEHNKRVRQMGGAVKSKGIELQL